jgi:hypothetical protein
MKLAANPPQETAPRHKQENDSPRWTGNRPARLLLDCEEGKTKEKTKETPVLQFQANPIL